MNTATLNTPLNPTQLRLLQMFSYTKNEEGINEMTEVLLNYIRNKVDEEGKRIWKEKNLNNEIMQEWLNTHVER